MFSDEKKQSAITWGYLTSNGATLYNIDYMNIESLISLSLKCSAYYTGRFMAFNFSTISDLPIM